VAGFARFLAGRDIGWSLARCCSFRWLGVFATSTQQTFSSTILLRFNSRSNFLGLFELLFDPFLRLIQDHRDRLLSYLRLPFNCSKALLDNWLKL
jgi:hypothetical protein